MFEYFTIGFAVIVILFFVVLLCIRKKYKVAPNILTTWGIFFTFFGISYGLYNFDMQSANISENINKLLDGLKLAFIPSAFGILLAIGFKVYDVFFLQKTETNKNNTTHNYTENQDISLREFADIFKLELQINLEKNVERLISQHESQNNRIALQLVDIRSDLREFKNEIVKNNTTSLIEALQQVLQDFNTKISDHLGDNFKALSSAVQSLVMWQDNYKSTIEKTNQDYNHLLVSHDGLLQIIKGSVNNIDNINNKIDSTNQHIVEMTSSIISTHNKLSTTSDELSTEATNLKENFAQFSILISTHAKDISNSTKNIVENCLLSELSLREHITKFKQESESMLVNTGDVLTQQINNLSSNMINTINLNKDMIDQSISTQKKTLEDILTQFSTTSLNSQNSIKTHVVDFISQSQQLLTNLKGTITQQIDSINTNINDLSATSKQHINDLSLANTQQIENLDKMLEAELNKALEGLGKGLTAISEKFVTDYTPLTERLKNLIELSKGI